jgi:hypothetical protein
MLELTTEEVIMNQVVVAHEESSRKDLYVAVVGDDGTLSRGPITIKDSTSRTFTVKLVNPGEDIPDLQYAIETTEGATFKGGGCDGKRSLGRLRDDLGLELTIHAPEKEIRVWAGWATQHEAVKLTDELLFTPVSRNVPEAHVEPIKTNAAEPPPNERDAMEDAHREAIEEAHKDALDTEIQVLTDEVHKIDHHDHHEPQHDTRSGGGGGEPENETKDTLLKKEPDSVQKNASGPHENAITRFKEAYQKKHTQKNASDRHGDTITRFKEAYQKKHVGELKNTRPDLQHKQIKFHDDPDPALRAPEKDTAIHKLQHEVWMRNYGKQQNEELLELQEKLLKTIQAQRSNGRLEKWTKKYNQDYDFPRVDLWQYIYGVVVMVVGMLSVIPLCLCIARHGKKGRRDL